MLEPLAISDPKTHLKCAYNIKDYCHLWRKLLPNISARYIFIWMASEITQRETRQRKQDLQTTYGWAQQLLTQINSIKNSFEPRFDELSESIKGLKKTPGKPTAPLRTEK